METHLKYCQTYSWQDEIVLLGDASFNMRLVTRDLIPWIETEIYPSNKTSIHKFSFLHTFFIIIFFMFFFYITIITISYTITSLRKFFVFLFYLQEYQINSFYTLLFYYIVFSCRIKLKCWFRYSHYQFQI